MCLTIPTRTSNPLNSAASLFGVAQSRCKPSIARLTGVCLLATNVPSQSLPTLYNSRSLVRSEGLAHRCQALALIAMYDMQREVSMRDDAKQHVTI